MADDIRGFNLKFGLDKADLDEGITSIKRSFGDLNSGLRRSKAEFESAERSAAEYGDEISDLNKAQKKLTANTSLLEKQMAECNTETAEGRNRHSRLVKEYNKESIAAAVLQKRIDELGDEYKQLAFNATVAGKAMRGMSSVTTTFDNIHSQIGTIAERFRNLGQIGTMVIRGMLMSNLSMLVPLAGAATSAIAGIGGALIAISGGAIGLAGVMGIAGAGFLTFSGMAKTALQMVEDGTMKASTQITRYKSSLSGLQSQWKGLVQANSKSIFNTMANGIDIARFALTKLTPFITKTSNMISQFSNRMLKWVETSRNASGAFNMLNQVGPPIMQNILNSILKVTDGLVHMVTKFAPLFTWVGAGLESMASKFNTWANSVSTDNGITNFINYTKTNLPIVGQIFGNIFGGIISVFQAFAPHSHTVLKGMQGITQSFKDWAANLAGSEGFKNFIAYLNTNGPKVWQVLKNIGSTIVSLVQGMAPLGAGLLNITMKITGFISGFFRAHEGARKFAGILTVVAGGIMMLIPAIGLIKGAMNGYAAVMEVAAFAQKAWQGVLMAGRTIQLGYMMATNGMTLAQMRQTLVTKLSTLATKAWSIASKGAAIAARGLGLAIRFMTGPVGIVITLIAALVAGIIYLWKTNSTFRKIVISSWNAIKTAAITVFGAVKNFIITAFNFIKSRGIAIWNGIKSAILTIIRLYVAGVKLYIYAIRTVITTVFNFIKSWSIRIWNGIKNGVLKIIRLYVAGVRGSFNLIKSTTIKIFNAIRSFLVAVWNNIRARVVATVRVLWNRIQHYWSVLSTYTKAIFNVIRKFLVSVWNNIRARIVAIVRVLWNRIQHYWATISKYTKAIFNIIKRFLLGIWTSIKNAVVSRVRSLWNGMKNIWNTLSKITRNIFNSLRSFLFGLWQKVRNRIVSIAQSLWNGVKSKWNALSRGTRDIFNRFRNYLVDKWTNIKNSVVGMVNTLKNKVTSTFGKMRDSLKGIIGKISGFIGKMVDGVKSGLNKLISGINVVGDKLGMGKEMIKPIKLSTGTDTSSTHTQNVVSNGAINQPTMAMVNDKGRGNGSGIGGRQELIQKANGTLLAPTKKNQIVGLDKGDVVHNGRTVQKAQQMGQLPKFAKGTGKKKKNFGDHLNSAKGKFGDKVEDTYHATKKGAGDLWNGGTKLAKGAYKSVSKKIGDIADWASKPGKLLNTILKSLGIGMKSFGIKKGNVPYDLMGGMFKKLKGGAVDLIKSWFEESEAGDGTGDAGWLFKHDIWQKFGAYTGGLGFNGGKHYGIDFGMTPGTNVRAVAGGKVSRVWNDYGGGNSMEIDLGGGLTNWYMHLNKQLKKKGDKVGVGDLIAKSGNTGNFTAGSGHLHFQLNKNGKPQANVLEWLKGLNSGGGKKKPSAWGGTIDKAAKKMKVKLSKSQRNGLIAQIQRESGGDAGITQDSRLKDGNSGANLAQGLLQYVPSTFKSFAVKGHGNIKSGYDQLLAFFNNSNWKNDLQYGKSGWGPNGSRRFATGGIIGKNGMYNLADGGFPEIVIPTDPSRSTDAMKLMNYASTKIKDKGKNKRPNQISNKYKGNNNGNNDNSEMLNVLAQMVAGQQEEIKLLKQLVLSNQNIADKPVMGERDVSNAQGKRTEMTSYNLGGAF